VKHKASDPFWEELNNDILNGQLPKKIK